MSWIRDMRCSAAWPANGIIRSAGYPSARRGEYRQAEQAYQLMCVEALAGHREETLAWREKALQRGFRDYNALFTNRQLASTGDDPRYNYLLRHSFPGSN